MELPYKRQGPLPPAISTSTHADKKAQKKLQNFFSSVSYRLTTAPHHELEGSVCLFGMNEAARSQFSLSGTLKTAIAPATLCRDARR